MKICGFYWKQKYFCGLCLSLWFFKKQLYYHWCKINNTYLKYTTWWILTYVFGHKTITVIKILNISVITKSFLMPCAIHSSFSVPSYFSRQPLICSLSLQTSSCFLEFYVNGIIAYILWCLASFAQCNYFGVYHIVYALRVHFYLMTILQFFSPHRRDIWVVSNVWPLERKLLWILSTSIGVDICFPCFWVNIYKQNGS